MKVIRSGSLNLSLAIAAIGWALIATRLAASDPIPGLLVGLSPIAALLLFRYGIVRLVVVVGGGLLVLGSSSDVSAAKLIYAPLALLCAVISSYRLLKDPPVFARTFRPLVWWGGAILAMFVVSLLVSPAGFDLATFARQAIFYIFIVIGPIVGLDAGREIGTRMVYALIGIVGVIGAVGFAADWLSRRGVTNLPVGKFILSSLMLPGFTFALAIVLAFHSRSTIARVGWAAVCLAIPVALLVTGTRTNLIVFIAIALVVGRASNVRVPPLRLLIALPVLGLVGFALFQAVASIAISDPNYLLTRVRASLLVLSGNGQSDQSFAIRSMQYQQAADAIGASPVFGMGFGYTLEFGGDTFLLTVVRVGWLGLATIIGFLIAMAIAVRSTRNQYGPSAANTAFWAFAGIVVANVPLGSPFEDRGFGFTLMLAMMAVASAATENAQASGSVDSDASTRRRERRDAVMST